MAYLRLHRERHEENHSPLQVEGSPVAFTHRARFTPDPHASVCPTEPRRPARSCALHPWLRGLGAARRASEVAVMSPSPPPLSTRPSQLFPAFQIPKVSEKLFIASGGVGRSRHCLGVGLFPTHRRT